VSVIKPEDQKRIEAEVNATIKLLMGTMEELAAQHPYDASLPGVFNDVRNQVIRRVWNLAKECIRYGASSVYDQ
jgi:nitrogen-specific signal transduction histidine kinase